MRRHRRSDFDGPSSFRLLPLGDLEDLLFRSNPLAGFRFRERRDFLSLLDGLNSRASGAGGSDNQLKADERYRLDSFVQYLRDALEQQQQEQQDQVAGAIEDRSKKGEEFLRMRPQRENRRYLLWRKITG